MSRQSHDHLWEKEPSERNDMCISTAAVASGDSKFNSLAIESRSGRIRNGELRMLRAGEPSDQARMEKQQLWVLSITSLEGRILDTRYVA